MNTGQNCLTCSEPFVIADDDLQFYQRLQVPLPTSCPDCREMRRMAWCNEGILYLRACDLCEKRGVSQYAPHNPKTAYCHHCWWGDKWDAMKYGLELNLERSILEQLAELLAVVPHCHTHTDLDNENSEYTHHAGHEKNCYMMFHCSFAEDCFYGYGVKKARDCVDNHYCHESELCYECIDVHHCYDAAWCQDCSDCSSSRFLFDCLGCTNCFLCTGLRKKSYYFMNKPLSKEEYEKRIAKLDLSSRAMVQKGMQQLEALKQKHTYKNLFTNMTENSLGNHLYNARESQHCFDCSDIEYSKYCSQLQLGTRHCHDIYQFGIDIELCYDSAMIGYNIYNCHFCYDLLQQCSDLQYCLSCHSTKDSFACFGLRKKQYCILNRQYQKEEYFSLREKIIEKMQADGEYGSFFPIAMSPHGYNETMALEWYPKSPEEVLQQGWHWENELPFSSGRATLREIPDRSSEVDDGILKEVLACEQCQRDFKLIQQEISFYKKNGFPIPHECFQCRRLRRMSQRDPRKFWLRQCDGCKADMPTTIAPDKPQKVFCEACYLERVY